MAFIGYMNGAKMTGVWDGLMPQGPWGPGLILRLYTIRERQRWDKRSLIKWCPPIGLEAYSTLALRPRYNLPRINVGFGLAIFLLATMC